LTGSKNVVLLSADLMTQSRIEAAARRCGLALRSTFDSESLLAKCAKPPAALVIVDLTLATVDIASVVSQLRSLPGAGPAVIAFGPHVHQALLDAANRAGCDEVLSRGQFFAQVDAILARRVTDSQ
jgi:DNA-binding NarL/FixJ family response regulator